MSEPLDRPSELEGQTYKVKWPDSEHALYITVNDIVLNGHRRPFEVFINSKNMEHFPSAQVVAVGEGRGKACPSCGQFDLRMVAGCMTCASCGHSKCG